MLPGDSARRTYLPAIGPRLKKLLALVFALFALLAVDSSYLATISIAEWRSGRTYQDYFYQVMFALHLALGFAIVIPVLVFGALHIRNAWRRPNRRAVRAGLALFATALVILGTGIILTRFEFFEVRDPAVRGASYWAHVIAPAVAVWLFVLHRLAGARVRWRLGLGWAAFAAAFAGCMLIAQSQDPRRWGVQGPASGQRYFFPSLARTATGAFIPAKALMMDDYCNECHRDTHEKWTHSAHRFSSFSNPAYLFSVRETRRVMQARDGNVLASRWCAGCHDPVPFLSGAFEEKRFDDPAYDLSKDPMAGAGITCTACHAITNINSPRGNADFTIEEPLHYPFAYSDNPVLRWINRQLVKAKPAFHKKTFLKPLHRSAEFCSTCHKVHLPPELNHYRWVRGQNHYDTYLLSGVSGHGVQSFYYPPKAVRNCAGCHMPLTPSGDFGARAYEPSGPLDVHDHQFAAANTAIPELLRYPPWVNEAHREFLQGAARVDLFAIKEGGTIEGRLVAPLRPQVPVLVPGRRYLLEAVVRTMRLGHPLTQGTVDSNELWLDVRIEARGTLLGRSGGMDDKGAVDPWSHFINVYMLDREGHRVDRRNPQDIFTPLYNNQIPPGAADTVHYAFTVPRNQSQPLTVEVRLQYRKFDATYVRHFLGDPTARDALPIVTLASDRVTFPVSGGPASADSALPSTINAWERWNDYGIGLLRKGDKGELRQAEAAFAEVERFGRGDGALNQARGYLREGRLAEAAEAIRRARSARIPSYPWTIAWFSALVDKQNGELDAAIANLREIVATQFDEARRREFDFSMDYTVLIELGQALFDRAKRERDPARSAQKDALLSEAIAWLERALAIDPENVAAHYALSLIHAQRGEAALAARHRELHGRYQVDENARDSAIARARLADPAARHAAEAVVIYDLQREGRYMMEASPVLGAQLRTASGER
jgi:tetratricopeptide (TPR) repeat protein